MTEDLTKTFTADSVEVPTGRMWSIPLRGTEIADDRLRVTQDGSVKIDQPGWYEVLLTVAWDPERTGGSRFSHTKTPDRHPIHSEAIEADVLAAISGGEQLLRGNTVLGGDGPDTITIEVWQDSGQSVTVKRAELGLRLLQAPGRPLG
jgi:hypothetical protein